MSMTQVATRPQFTAITPYPVVLQAPPPPSASLPQVDLRPRIQSLNLAVRAQAPRPTCSVFAMTFLLEFLYGTRLATPVNDLSEEYLNYASNVVGGEFADGDFFDHLDAGYQTWGIVPEASAPYQTTPVSTIAQNILNAGRLWSRFRADFIKPWDATKGASQTQLDQAITYLDGQIPVAFGGWWPDNAHWKTKVINGIEVMDVASSGLKNIGVFDGHSVALVGYRRDSAFAGGGYFVFRNSWGADWGDHGYGYMPFAYVLAYANDLVAYTTRHITTARIGPQAVVARPDRLQVFVTDNSGPIATALWQQDMLGGQWRGWWPVLDGRAVKGTPVTVVSRGPDKLDAFVAGTDGRTYTPPGIAT
jgi:hypothetical protein